MGLRLLQAVAKATSLVSDHPPVVGTRASVLNSDEFAGVRAVAVFDSIDERFL